MLSTPEWSLKCMEMSQDHIVLTSEVNISIFIVSGAKAPLGLCRFASCGSSCRQSTKDPRDWTWLWLAQTNKQKTLRVTVHVWAMERMAKRGQTWRERDGASVEQSWSQWKHTVTVWHSQPSPPADAPRSQVLSQLITLSERLPTAKNLLPNLIMTLQTLVTIALWEHIHTYSLQRLWPQVKLSI